MFIISYSDVDHMIIQNFEELAVTDKKKDCLEILEAGLQAANPQNILPHYVTPNEIKINHLSDLSVSNSDSHFKPSQKSIDNINVAIA